MTTDMHTISLLPYRRVHYDVFGDPIADAYFWALNHEEAIARSLDVASELDLGDRCWIRDGLGIIIAEWRGMGCGRPAIRLM